MKNKNNKPELETPNPSLSKKDMRIFNINSTDSKKFCSNKIKTAKYNM